MFETFCLSLLLSPKFCSPDPRCRNSVTLHMNQTAWSCFISWVQHRENQTEPASSKAARFHLFFFLCTLAKLLQSCQTLCDPMDSSWPGSSVHGILQARILEWVAIPSSKGSFWPRNRTHISYISCIAGGFFTHWTTWEALKTKETIEVFYTKEKHNSYYMSRSGFCKVQSR